MVTMKISELDLVWEEDVFCFLFFVDVNERQGKSEMASDQGFRILGRSPGSSSLIQAAGVFPSFRPIFRTSVNALIVG